MSNKYSDQYQSAFVNVPASKINSPDQSGGVKHMYMSFTGAAELGTSDTLYLGKIPAGSRVVECKVRCPATGATGTFDIGYQANGVDAAALNGFVVAANPGAAAVYAAGNGAAMGKKFTAETDVVLTPSAATASFTGKTVEFWMLLASI